MYEFVQTDKGWLVCWGPTPVEQVRGQQTAEPELAGVAAEMDPAATDVVQPMAV